MSAKSDTVKGLVAFFCGGLVFPGIDVLAYLFLRPTGFYPKVITFAIFLFTAFPMGLAAASVTTIVAKVLDI